MSAYDPETVELLRSVLDEAWAALQPAHRKRISKAWMAQCVLKCAAAGERHPDRLRFRAISHAVKEAVVA
jgi:hypothetical protein